MQKYFVTLIFALLALTAGQARAGHAARPDLASVMEMFMLPENSRKLTLPWDVEADNPAITWYDGPFTSENGTWVKQGIIRISSGERQGWEIPAYERPVSWSVILEGGPAGVELVILFPSDGPFTRHPSYGRSVFETAAAQNRRMRFSTISSTSSLHNGYETRISRYRLSCSGKRSITVEHAISATPNGSADELALIISKRNQQADTTDLFTDQENEQGMQGNRADRDSRPDSLDADPLPPKKADKNKNAASRDSEAKLNERLEKSRKMAQDLMQ